MKYSREKSNPLVGACSIFLVLGYIIFSSTLLAEEFFLAPIQLENPRDTMRSYLNAMEDYKRGIEKNNTQLIARIYDAARCFNLDGTPFVLRSDKGKEAAILLKEVLDRVIIIDDNKIPGSESVPSLKRWRLKGTEITIAVINNSDSDRAGEYLFTQDTSYRVKHFYHKVKHLPYLVESGGGAYYQEPWFEKSIPAWAKRKWLFFTNWQWIGMFLAILVGLIIKTILQHIVDFLRIAARKTVSDWDDKIVEAIDRPIGLLGAAIFWFFSLYLLQFEGNALAILRIAIQIILSTAVIWLCYRLVEVLTEYLSEWTKTTDSVLDDHLVPLIQKALRIFIVVFGILLTFQNLGVNLFSIFAGLGLGGLAFALAARDMCANFFGSIMILLDRPFNPGDWIVVGNIEGTVEEIGFRSTRVRTFYNSQVSIPNSVIANANVDNMGRRKYRRIKAFFGLTYDTPAEKVEAFLEGIKYIIEANQYTRKDYYHVVFYAYGNSSLQVMLYCFLEVSDWAVELVERQNIYLEIFRLAEKIGVEFAFPTQTIHMEAMGEKNDSDQVGLNQEELQKQAQEFGPSGKEAKPEGLGIFIPPYRHRSSSSG